MATVYSVLLCDVTVPSGVTVLFTTDPTKVTVIRDIEFKYVASDAFDAFFGWYPGSADNLVATGSPADPYTSAGLWRWEGRLVAPPGPAEFAVSLTSAVHGRITISGYALG